MTPEEFKRLWVEDWKFSLGGVPEDACIYLEQVLEAVRTRDESGPRSYLENIGSIEGQQKFLFLWMHSVGLVDAPNTEGDLTQNGRNVLAVLTDGVQYSVFFGQEDDGRSNGDHPC